MQNFKVIILRRFQAGEFPCKCSCLFLGGEGTDLLEEMFDYVWPKGDMKDWKWGGTFLPTSVLKPSVGLHIFSEYTTYIIH